MTHTVNATKIDIVVTPIQVDPTKMSQKFMHIDGLFDKNGLKEPNLTCRATEYFLHTVKHNTPQGSHLHYHMVKQTDYNIMVDLLGLVRGSLEQMKADFWRQGYERAIQDVIAGNVDFDKI